MIAIKELARQFLDGYYHHKMSDFTTKTMSWELYQNGFDEFYYYFFDRRWAVLLYIGSRLYVMIMIFFFSGQGTGRYRPHLGQLQHRQQQPMYPPSYLEIISWRIRKNLERVFVQRSASENIHI